MTAGAKNQRVDVQQRSGAADGAGGQTVTWTTLASGIWANIRAALADERLSSRDVVAVVGQVVTVWYASALASVSVKDRVIWGDRVLEIQAVNDPGNLHRELEWRCLEVQA
jgi:SPP1 family predicted phage head-tail adaptor